MNPVQDAGMSPLIWKGGEPWSHRKPVAPLAACALLMLLPSASCVPLSAVGAPRVAGVPAPDLASDGGAAVAVGSAADAIASFTAPPAVTDPAVTDPAAADPLAPANVLPGAAPAINAAIAFDRGPNPAASAFFLRAGSPADRARSLQCLTEAVYYEAASESDDGQRAVAQVVLNRMRHPAYPATVCGVVYQNADRWLACQFSFACDGARARVPSAVGWARARAHAAQALAGRVHAPVGNATHYHTWNVVPFWAHKLEKTAVVGMHIFYRLNGALGRAAAFRQRYAGYEPFPTSPRLAPPPPVQFAVAPVPVVEVAMATPAATPVPMSAATPRPVTRTAASSPAIQKTFAPEPAPVLSPIMRAVESSTVRDAYRQSGTIRPEFNRGASVLNVPPSTVPTTSLALTDTQPTP